MEKGGWEQDILGAITGEEAAVYCGKSAGAIIAGARMDTATWKVRTRPSSGDIW
jgi:peptidase E